MKKNRRIILILVSVLLCVVFTATALAQGALGALYASACKLLFETDNVTLSADVSFSYRNQLFKTLNGEYLQDGTNSYMNITLITPNEMGEDSISGYTVIGQGEHAYSIETMRPQYYTSQGTTATDSILTSTVMRRSVMQFGALFLDMLEETANPFIQSEETSDGTRYTISVPAGASPEIANALVTVLAEIAAREYFGYHFFDNTPQKQLRVWADNWDALFAHLYEQTYNQLLPENYYEVLWGEESELSKTYDEQYNTVNAAIRALEKEQEELHDSGMCLIRNDGSVDYFSTYDEYLIANNMQYALYESTAAVFCHWYEMTTGQKLTTEEYHAVSMTNNEDLYVAFAEMYQAMDAYYMDILRTDEKASAIAVYGDGSYTLIHDVDAYDAIARYGTVKQVILHSMQKLILDETNVTVTLDTQGRFVSAQGAVRLLVEDTLGERAPLDIELDLSASAYGDSSVKPFDPEDYGVVTLQEYHENYEYYAAQEEPAVYPQLPETVVFNGVQYQVRLAETDGNG